MRRVRESIGGRSAGACASSITVPSEGETGRPCEGVPRRLDQIVDITGNCTKGVLDNKYRVETICGWKAFSQSPVSRR